MTLPLHAAGAAAHEHRAAPLRRIRSTTRRTPLDGLRAALLGRGDVHWLAIGGSALAGMALFAVGTLFFLYQDRQYADVI
jgi:hypothetical protein